MNGRWTNDEEWRLQNLREHVIYRFDAPSGEYCYIGLTANLDRRIAVHCSKPNGTLYSFLSRYRADPAEARRHFCIIDQATGLRQAEEQESAHILDALLESCDPARPFPRNRMTHQIDPENFGKIVAIAEHARTAQGLIQESRRVDEINRRLERDLQTARRRLDGEMAGLRQQHEEEKRRLMRLVDTETASRKRIEGKKHVYQTLCAFLLLVLGVLAVLRFGSG